MKKYTLKRILTSLFTLLAILLVLFILMQLMPGSPFNDEKLTPHERSPLSIFSRSSLFPFASAGAICSLPATLPPPRFA